MLGLRGILEMQEKKKKKGTGEGGGVGEQTDARVGQINFRTFKL